jgi:hypothetical protein
MCPRTSWRPQTPNRLILVAKFCARVGTEACSYSKPQGLQGNTLLLAITSPGGQELVPPRKYFSCEVANREWCVAIRMGGVCWLLREQRTGGSGPLMCTWGVFIRAGRIVGLLTRIWWCVTVLKALWPLDQKFMCEIAVWQHYSSS